jgi:hypothetical protein
MELTLQHLGLIEQHQAKGHGNITRHRSAKRYISPPPGHEIQTFLVGG